MAFLATCNRIELDSFAVTTRSFASMLFEIDRAISKMEVRLHVLLS